MEQDSSWNDLVGKAKEEVDSYESRGNKDSDDYTPMVFLRNGSHKIRIYPDRSVPGRTRLIRRINFHRANVTLPGKDGKPAERSLRVRCEGEGVCKVCNVMAEANKQGYTNSWTHGNSNGLCYGIVYESSEKSDFIKLNVPVVIALEYKMIYAFNKMISGYTGAEVKSIIDTVGDSNIIEIDHKSGSGGNTIVRLDPIRRKPLPELPKHFRPLDELFVEDKPGSDEDVKLICQAIMTQAKKKSEVIQPDGSQITNGGVATKPELTPNEPPVTHNVGSATLSSPAGTFIGLPGVIASNPPDVKSPDGSPQCWGAHPEKGHPICGACEYEPTCLKTTITNKLAKTTS